MTKKSKTAPSPAMTHFPSPIRKEKSTLTDEEKIHLIAEHFRKIMELLDLDLTHDSLAKTPHRVAKMFVKEVFSGLKEENFPELSFFYDEIHHVNEEHKPNVIFTRVSFTSFCEHHFVPIMGYAYIAYLPENKIIGLSKIPRLVRYFARRPQLQERLTAQIADSLVLLLKTENVAVSINAHHLCVTARGVRDEHSYAITNVLRGKFDSNQNLRREFFESVNRQDLD